MNNIYVEMNLSNPDGVRTVDLGEITVDPGNKSFKGVIYYGGREFTFEKFKFDTDGFETLSLDEFCDFINDDTWELSDAARNEITRAIRYAHMLLAAPFVTTTKLYDEEICTIVEFSDYSEMEAVIYGGIEVLFDGKTIRADAEFEGESVEAFEEWLKDLYEEQFSNDRMAEIYECIIVHLRGAFGRCIHG